MRFGPMDDLDLGRLKDILDPAGVAYQVDASQEILDTYQEQRSEAARAPRARPTYDGSMKFLFIDIPDDSLGLVQDELEKLGYWHHEVLGNELDADPEFEALVRRNEERRSAGDGWRAFAYVAIAGAIVFAGWFVFTHMS